MQYSLESGKYAFQMEMTFLALRFQQLKDKLLNLDLFHDFIISDYYVAKSLIFSKETLQPDEYDLFARFFNIVFAKLLSSAASHGKLIFKSIPLWVLSKRSVSPSATDCIIIATS